ncbi:MAG: P-loop NTPase [Defluviitaleaceae bacterium]|nr:P-loop NTPase [Defluviitaleaceae bacterium]
MKDQAESLRNLVKKPVLEKAEIKGAAQNKSSNSVKKPRIITVASGKGGVGKSSFVLNVAMCMVQRNIKVCIIDANFGMANISALTGKVSSKSLAQVLNKTVSIEEVIEKIYGGIHIISSSSGFSELSNIENESLDYLIKSFYKLGNLYDIILIDCGSGAGASVIKLINASSEAVVITTPEPASLIDAYSLIKIVKAANGMANSLNSISPLLYIAVNRVKNYDEGLEVYKKMSEITANYTGLELSLIGLIPEDINLQKSIRSQKPISALYPNTISNKNFNLIAERILERNTSFGTSNISFLSKLRKIY